MDGVAQASVSRISLLAFLAPNGDEIIAKNVSARGNAIRSDDINGARGLRFLRAEGNVLFDNMVIMHHTKAIEVLDDPSPNNANHDLNPNPLDGKLVTLRRILSFDTWQEFGYFQMHDVRIEDSVIRRTGGPAMLLVERFFNNNPRGPRIDIYNSEITNYNPANAAWFSLYGMTPAIMDFFFVDSDFLRPFQNMTIMPEARLGNINFIAMSRIYTTAGHNQNPGLHQARGIVKMDGYYLINNAKHVPNNPFLTFPTVPGVPLPLAGLPPLVFNHTGTATLTGLPSPLPPTLPVTIPNFDFDVSPHHLTLYANVPIAGTGPIGAAVRLHQM